MYPRNSAARGEFTWGAHPTGSITGPTAVAVNTNASFSVTAADANANLSAIQVLRASTSGGAWTSLGQLNCSGGSCSGNVNWTPTATGSYFVTLNVSDTVGLYCTGNFNNGKDLWGATLPGHFYNCGASDYLTVTVGSPAWGLRINSVTPAGLRAVGDVITVTAAVTNTFNGGLDRVYFYVACDPNGGTNAPYWTVGHAQLSGNPVTATVSMAINPKSAAAVSACGLQSGQALSGMLRECPLRVVNARLGTTAHTGDGQSEGSWWVFWDSNPTDRKRAAEWQAITGMVSGPVSVMAGSLVTRYATARALDAQADLNNLELYASPTGSQNWTLLGQTNCAGAGADCTLTAGHTFGLPGNYYVTLNAGDEAGNWCTGNYNNGLDLWGGALPPGLPAGDCGPSDRLTVTVAPAPLTPPPTNHTWRLYYHAGGQRVAMRVLTGTLNTLYYLHGDHLGSTSKVTCGNAACGALGSVVATQYYAPFGGVRYATGTLPTDYGFTGQRLDADIGLHFYNARFYDARTGRFVSADTIVPGAGNPQALNRYSYVLNSPTRYTDPTGHYCYDPTGGAHAGTCLTGEKSAATGQTTSVGTFQAVFGVVFQGDWQADHIAAAMEAIYAVGNRLAQFMSGHTAYSAFRAAYGTSRAKPMKLEWNVECYDCRSVETISACGSDFAGTCAAGGAYTYGARHITFATMAARHHSDAALRWRNHVVHELGHAFNVARGRAPESALQNAIDVNSGFDRSGASPNYGFASPPSSFVWVQSPQNTASEIFADMFLGWTFNTWETKGGAITPQGALRANWMNTNVRDWLP